MIKIQTFEDLLIANMDIFLITLYHIKTTVLSLIGMLVRKYNEKATALGIGLKPVT